HRDATRSEHRLENRASCSNPAILSTTSKIPDSSEASTRLGKRRNSCEKRRSRIVRRKAVEKTMPVVALQPKHKIAPWFVNLTWNNGKVRLYLEASKPVDVFVVNALQAPQINSVLDARKLGVLTYPATTAIDQIITLPTLW